ncbi:MAG: cob(I)yrinic acid a,c-diamide adenosyltransferase [Candidatus Aenigmatarchaeota archaeon]
MKKVHRKNSSKTCLAGMLKSKDDLLVECIGELDELNSFIGVVRESLEFNDLDKILGEIQRQIFEIGACLHLGKKFNKENVSYLERSTENFEKELSEIKNFVFPIGKLQYCRALCRRAERRFISLSKVMEIDKNILTYLNRLSDFLFVLGRIYTKRKGLEEKLWLP